MVLFPRIFMQVPNQVHNLNHFIPFMEDSVPNSKEVMVQYVAKSQILDIRVEKNSKLVLVIFIIYIIGLGRIAGIVSLEVEDKNAQLDAIQHIGSELAMHVVAAKPLFLTKELVSSDALESEREILKSQVLGNIMFSIILGSELYLKDEIICDYWLVKLVWMHLSSCFIIS